MFTVFAFTEVCATVICKISGTVNLLQSLCALSKQQIFKLHTRILYFLPLNLCFPQYIVWWLKQLPFQIGLFFNNGFISSAVLLLATEYLQERMESNHEINIETQNNVIEELEHSLLPASFSFEIKCVMKYQAVNLEVGSLVCATQSDLNLTLLLLSLSHSFLFSTPLTFVSILFSTGASQQAFPCTTVPDISCT